MSQEFNINIIKQGIAETTWKILKEYNTDGNKDTLS